MASPVAILNVTPTSGLATCHNALVLASTAPPDAKAIGSVRDAMLQLARRHRQGVIALGFVQPSGLETPDVAARDAIQGLLSDKHLPCAGLALVLSAEGFVGAGIRSLVTGIIMVSRPSIPLKVFGAADEATHWLGGRNRAVGVTALAPADLLDALGALRRAVEEKKTAPVSAAPRPRSNPAG